MITFLNLFLEIIKYKIRPLIAHATKVKNPKIDKLKALLVKVLERIAKYVPGYKLLLGPVIEDGKIIVMIRVRGLGDYLPQYAGNLDIINCAALEVGNYWAKEIMNE